VTYHFNTRKANWEGFTHSPFRLKTTIITSSIEMQARTIVSAIQQAATENIPQHKAKSTRVGKQPWWNAELGALKSDLDRKRRQGLHRSDRPTYNTAKNRYLTEIRAAKALSWRNFANDLNANVWGKAFRWAKRGTKARTVPSTLKRNNGTHTDTISETADLLLNSFFPRENQGQRFKKYGPLTAYEKAIDAELVKASIWRMKPNKAPGKDGLTAGILRKAWPILFQEITSLFGKCIEEATFPQEWKDAKLVVLPKPGKTDLGNPKSYRPVSLLPTLAKALETLVIQDLEAEIRLNAFDL